MACHERKMGWSTWSSCWPSRGRRSKSSTCACWVPRNWGASPSRTGEYTEQLERNGKTQDRKTCCPWLWTSSVTSSRWSRLMISLSQLTGMNVMSIFSLCASLTIQCTTSSMSCKAPVLLPYFWFLPFNTSSMWWWPYLPSFLSIDGAVDLL